MKPYCNTYASNKRKLLGAALLCMFVAAVLLVRIAAGQEPAPPQTTRLGKLYRLLDFRQGVAISCKDGLQPSVQKNDQFVIVDCQHVVKDNE